MCWCNNQFIDWRRFFCLLFFVSFFRCWGIQEQISFFSVCPCVEFLYYVLFIVPDRPLWNVREFYCNLNNNVTRFYLRSMLIYVIIFVVRRDCTVASNNQFPLIVSLWTTWRKIGPIYVYYDSDEDKTTISHKMSFV